MRRHGRLARGVAIVGAGMSKFGLFKEKDCKDLFLEAYWEMLSSVDKSIDPKDIDAMYIGNFTNDFFVHQGHWGPIISDVIGHVPKPVTRTEGACASSALAFKEGVLAIASGYYDIVLVGGIEQMSKRSTEECTEGLMMAGIPYEYQAGYTFPGVFGSLATAYFEKYGANREHLMNITIKSHNNACLNPKAQFNVSIRDIMETRIKRCREKGEPVPAWKDEKDFLRDPVANPLVAWPMYMFDCCPISDGAACLLLVTEKLAKNFTDEPIYVAGIGQGSGYGLHATKELTSFEATKHAAWEAFEVSGLGPKDIHFAEVHDCFSIAEVIHLEDIGFYRPGEAYKTIAEGVTKLDGPLPINPSGGLKCKGHPVGATGAAQLFEIWEQLRGKAGERQIRKPNLRVGAAQNMGGTGGTSTVTILERR